MKEKKTFELGDIEVKRFYFDGELSVDCPSCKKKLTRDFSQDYLSYPSFGGGEMLYFYCDECDCEFELPTTMKAKVEFEFDKDDIKKL